MTIVLPGEKLGSSKESKGGIGTYLLGQSIYSSLKGTVSNKDNTIYVKTTIKEKGIPQVGSIVTAKVIRINPRQATLDILTVGPLPCTESSFQGIIRQQDVRSTLKDSVQIFKCFRPGDVVRAQIISLGDSRSYLLTTASNEYGVILAQSEHGHTMIPISWDKMMCPVTKQEEFRKCAKPM